MNSNPLFFLTFTFVQLSKIGHSNLLTQMMGNYIVYPARNPSLFISGSVVTLTSLNQWNLFDVRNIFGGSIEHMMVLNALSIIQFMIGCRATIKKDKKETESEKKVDSKITSLQTEICELKSKLATQAV